jgi:hypothetical protein
MCPEKWLPFVLVTKKGVSLTTQECRLLRKTYRTGTSVEQKIDLALRSAGSLVCKGATLQRATMNSAGTLERRTVQEFACSNFLRISRPWLPM